MQLRLLPFLLGALCFPGCPKGGGSPDIWGPSLGHPDEQTMALLMAAGDKPALMVVIKPDQWKASKQTLRTFLEAFPLPEPAIINIFSSPDLPSAVVHFMAALGAPAEGLPRTLPGLDPGRPVVAALFEPGETDLTWPVRVIVPDGKPAGFQGLRHRVLVPALDVPLVAETLLIYLASMDLAPDPGFKQVAGKRGASLCLLPGDEGFVAVIPEKDHVRLEILTHHFRANTSQDQSTGTGGGTPQRDRWLSLLGRPIQTGSVIGSPALHYLAETEDLVTFYVRPWQLTDLGSQLGSYMVANALGYADPEEKAMLLSAGMAEVLNSLLLMTPLGAEMDDIALGFSATDRLRWNLVAGLTRRGARSYWAGAEGLSAPFVPSDIPAMLRVSVPVNMGLLLEHARAPRMVEQSERLVDAWIRYQECGILCFWHTLLRHPVGITKALRKFDTFEGLKQMPQAAHLTLVDIDFNNPIAPFKAAVAASFPEQYDTAWLEKAMKSIEKPPKLKTHLVVESRPGAKIVMAGFNIDPREVYSLQKSNPDRGLMGAFRLDLEPLARMAGMNDPVAAKIMRRMSPLNGQAILSGPALVVEVTVGDVDPTAVGRARKIFRVPEDYHGMKWPSPGLKEASSKEYQCLLQAIEKVQTALKGLSRLTEADADSLTKIVQKFEEEAGSPLACARARETTRTRADNLHRLFTLLVELFRTRTDARQDSPPPAMETGNQ